MLAGAIIGIFPGGKVKLTAGILGAMDEEGEIETFCGDIGDSLFDGATDFTAGASLDVGIALGIVVAIGALLDVGSMLMLVPAFGASLTVGLTLGGIEESGT